MPQVLWEVLGWLGLIFDEPTSASGGRRGRINFVQFYCNGAVRLSTRALATPFAVRLSPECELSFDYIVSSSQFDGFVVPTAFQILEYI